MDGVIRNDSGFLIGVVQITFNNVFNHFRNEALLTEQWYLKMEDQKQWPGLARNQDFDEGGGREVNVEKLKGLNWEKGEQSSVTQTYHRRGLGAKLPATGQFFEKKNRFLLFRKPIEKLNCLIIFLLLN